MLLATALLALLPADAPVSGSHPPLPFRPAQHAPYTIFNPKPRDEMRPISADRPDTTESAITVDPGHYQFEISFGEWSRERSRDAYIALQTNAKVGLTESVDFQILFNSYEFDDEPEGPDDEGFSDIQARLKVNLWGNDGGDSALAFFPYVKLPTGTGVSNDEVEGGLIIPFAAALTESIDLGLMAQFDAVYDEVVDDHNFEFLHTAAVGLPVAGDVATFLEYVGVAAEDDYQAGVNVGFTLQPTLDLIFDAGLRVGLSDDVDDLGAFFGATVRY